MSSQQHLQFYSEWPQMAAAGSHGQLLLSLSALGTFDLFMAVQYLERYQVLTSVDRPRSNIRHVRPGPYR